MTNGRADDPNQAMLDHEFELADHQSRLDELEDRLSVVYPAPDTPAGGAQRVRIEIPSPASVLTIGARGSATSEGQAIGPGGFGLRTDASFGAQIVGGTCVDTDGVTIVHSGDAARMVTQADLGLAAASAVRVGTDGGDVEVTAGGVPANDPDFTVVPSEPVPSAPEVDTATPRGPAESEASGLGAVWTSLSVAKAIRTWQGLVAERALSSGVAAGTLSSRVAGGMSAVRALVAAFDAGRTAAAAAADAFDVMEPADSGDPKVKLHGAGGVLLTSPAKVKAFGYAISLAASYTASIKAAWSASVASAGYASLYGGMAASVASEGPAGVKSYGNAATLSGKYADVSAKETAVVRSDGAVQVSAGDNLSLESKKVAIGAEEVGVSGSDFLEVEGDVVVTTARTQNNVFSDGTTRVRAHERIDLHVENKGVEIESGEIRLDPGGSLGLELKPDSVKAGGKLELTSSAFRVRGVRIHLG